jgi:hypothetical protein
MPKFNYDAPAELFPSRRYAKGPRARFQRFERAADAVRYVVEDMPATWLNGTILEVDEQRFEGSVIRALYDARDYPLRRAKIAA